MILSALSALTSVGAIIQSCIAIKNEFSQNNRTKENEQINYLIKQIEGLKSDNKLISRQELLEIMKKNSTPSSLVIQRIFGKYISCEEANKIIKNQINTIKTVSHIDLLTIDFKESDLVFSSFGTPGFTSYLNDGKSVVIFHCSGDDEGRIFAVRWGIGFYYRKYLGPTSFLGFPTSNEYSTEPKGRKGARNDFEGGYIEYLTEFNRINIYRNGMKGSILIGTHDF